MLNKKQPKKSKTVINKPSSKTIVSLLMACAVFLGILVLIVLLVKVIIHLINGSSNNTNSHDTKSTRRGQLESLSEQMTKDQSQLQTDSTANKLKSNQGVVYSQINDTDTKLGLLSDVGSNVTTIESQKSFTLNKNLEAIEPENTNLTAISPISESEIKGDIADKVKQINDFKDKGSHSVHDGSQARKADYSKPLTVQSSSMTDDNANPASPNFNISLQTNKNYVHTKSATIPLNSQSSNEQSLFNYPYNDNVSLLESIQSRVQFQHKLLAESNKTTPIFECTSENGESAILNLKSTDSGHVLKFYQSGYHGNFDLQFEQSSKTAYLIEHTNGYEILMKQKGYWYRFIQFIKPTTGVDATFSQYSVRNAGLINRFYCVGDSVVAFDEISREKFDFVPKNDALIKILQSFE